MCGRYPQAQLRIYEETFRATPRDVAEGFQRFNVAPMQLTLVVVEDARDRILTPYRWGLIPAWARDVTIGSKLINARAETVCVRPAFRDAFRRRRCIVPADAFYEWRSCGRARVPHAVLRRDRRPLALAGLWESWCNPRTREQIRTCVIITTSANSLMTPIHRRMPVILPESTWDCWLDPKFDDVDALQAILQPCPSEWLEAYEVSHRVNDPRDDQPELLEPLKQCQLRLL